MDPGEEVSQTEVAVGRLPVTTNAELAEVIRKIIAREAALTEPWLHSALLLADDADDGGLRGVKRSGGGLALQADLPVVRGYFESQGVDESRIRLLDALNAGTGYVSYFGHGGFDQLADESLFTSVDAPLLTNAQRPAIMTAMTCRGQFRAPRILVPWGGPGPATRRRRGGAVGSLRDVGPLARPLARNCSRNGHGPKHNGVSGTPIPHSQRAYFKAQSIGHVTSTF